MAPNNYRRDTGYKPSYPEPQEIEQEKEDALNKLFRQWKEEEKQYSKEQTKFLSKRHNKQTTLKRRK